MTDHREAALADYVNRVPATTICRRYDISDATLRRWRRAAGIPPRVAVHTPRVQRERYKAVPETPLARRVRRVYEAMPDAGVAAWARASGASEGYVSRLVGHWRAGEAA